MATEQTEKLKSKWIMAGSLVFEPMSLGEREPVVEK